MIRVLFGCTGWPSGLLDVASWAKHQGLAEAIVFQLQPGRTFDLGREVLIPENFEPARFAEAIAGYARRTGQTDRLLASDGSPGPIAREALLIAGGDWIVKLIEFEPHVVGFRLEGGGLEQVRQFIRVVRLFSGAEVVLGGPTPTSHPCEVLDECGADYVFAGEAEETFAQFLRLARTSSSRDLAAQIPGLAYRYGGRTWHNTLPRDGYGRSVLEAGAGRCGRPLGCLRNLVRPAADAAILAANRLDWSLLKNFRRESDSLFFTGGRGCPGACTFCSKLHGQELRVKSAEQLLEEIAAADAKLADGTLRVTRWRLFEHVDEPALRDKKVAWAAVFDEDFFLNRRRATDFFRLWEQSPLAGRYRLNFQTNPCSLLDSGGRPHADLISWIDRLKPMIQLGAESFHDEVLRRWHKRHTVAQLNAVLDALDQTRQDYTVFQLLTDFQTTAEELIESLRRLVLAAMGRPRMRIASSPFTIPLYDSDTRPLLEHAGRSGVQRVGHFTEYEQPQPGWMDPWVAELADLADAELQFTLSPQHRDAALGQLFEVLLERVGRRTEQVRRDRGRSACETARMEQLLAQTQRAAGQVREARFRPVDIARVDS